MKSTDKVPSDSQSLKTQKKRWLLFSSQFLKKQEKMAQQTNVSAARRKALLRSRIDRSYDGVALVEKARQELEAARKRAAFLVKEAKEEP